MLRVYIMNMLGVQFGSYAKYPFISDVRKKKINSYRNENDKLLSLGCELLLNRALQDLDPNIKLPAEYTYDNNGRPYFIDLPYHISFSHSENISVLAISDEKVGIDAQFMEECDYDKLARRFFPLEEALTIHSADDFFKIWTLKEAYTKFLGLGMKKPFKSFMVDPNVEESASHARYYLEYKKEYKICLFTTKPQKIEMFII